MKFIREDRGFTLAEVVISLVILATVGSGLLRVMFSAQQMRPVQMDRSLAYHVGRQQLESLYEAVRQDWWPVANLPLSPGTSMGNSRQVIVGGRTYSISYSVAAVNLKGDSNKPDYRKVVATVI